MRKFFDKKSRPWTLHLFSHAAHLQNTSLRNSSPRCWTWDISRQTRSSQKYSQQWQQCKDKRWKSWKRTSKSSPVSAEWCEEKFAAHESDWRHCFCCWKNVTISEKMKILISMQISIFIDTYRYIMLTNIKLF